MGKSWDQYRLGEPYEAPRRKGLKTVAIVSTLLAITILPAMAARGGNGAAGGGKGHGGGGSTGGTSSIAWKMVTDVNGNNAPNYADQITFTVSTTVTTRPFVALDCHQGGTRVYSFSAGIFPDYLFTDTYTLKSSWWTGGSADCTAQAYYTASNGREVIFDRLDFTVAE